MEKELAMKNLFSPYRSDSFPGFISLRLSLITSFSVIIFLIMILFVEISFNSIFTYVFAAAAVLIPILSVVSYFQIRNYLGDTFAELTKQTNSIAHGNFENRITNITSSNEFAKMAWQLNDVTDQFEAFMKEVDTSTKYASEHKFYRKPMATGLRGMMKRTIKSVSNSLDFQAETMVLKELQDYLDRNTALILSAMKSFSEGDLTIKIDKEKEGDIIAKIIDAFNEMVKTQEQIIQSISDAVQATASAGAEISASADEMAAGAQEQSSQTTEVTSSVEQVSSSIIQTTQKMNTASSESKRSKMIAEEGGVMFNELEKGIIKIADVVLESSEIVNRLGQSSEKIGEIVQVIDEIADQTNLLALNAAIEAARAGEQGRGFAVVADEVRKLAERTTKSTKEIAEMIRAIQQETKNAVDSMHKGKSEVEVRQKSVVQASKSLNEIIKSSNLVMSIVDEVTEAGKEEAGEISQIMNNISGINTVAHDFAIRVEQIAHASEDLNRLTLNLQELITQFKVDESGSGNLAVRKNGKLIHV
jgi:methyl-accepting chemotaxis protein